MSAFTPGHSDMKRLGDPTTGMAESPAKAGILELREYASALMRRWWIVAAAALLAFAAAWWVESGKVPVYTTEVLLQQQREAPLVGGISGGQPGEFSTQLEILRSRAVVAEVADSIGFRLALSGQQGERSRIIEDVWVEREAPPGSYTLTRRSPSRAVLSDAQGNQLASVAGEGWVEGPGFRFRLLDFDVLDPDPLRFSIRNQQAAVEQLRARVRVEPGRAPGMVRIAYTDQDPVMAAEVVNRMAAAYQGVRERGSREAASRRREVIADQLVALADSLNAAQAAVVEYQRASELLDPAAEGSQLVSAVLEMERELRTLRYQEGLLSSVVASLQADNGGGESLNRFLSLGSGLVPAGPALHQRLQDLQIERARLTASRFGRTEGDPEVEVIDNLIASTRAQMVTAAEQALEHLRAQIEGTEGRLAEVRGDMGTVPGRTAELDRLRQRADAVQDIVDTLVDRYYEAQIAEAVEMGDVAVIDPGLVPLSPDRSQTRLNLTIALIGGLLLGALGAMVLEYLDLRVRRGADAEAITGLPLIAMIPKLRSPSRDPISAAIGKEAFRSLRTNLHFARNGEPRVLALTSATPREGKTTVAANLAGTFAERQGPEEVILIDADLRRPEIHRVFGMDRSPGLSDVLMGTVELDDAIQVSSAHPKLHVLSSGSSVPNPSEVIDSDAFVDLIAHLRSRFGFVVIDTPPLLAVSDGGVVAKAADGALVVVRANRTDRTAVATAMEQLRQIDAPLLGVILNAAGTTAEGHYSYYEEYLSEEAEHAGAGKGREKRKHRLIGAGRS